MVETPVGMKCREHGLSPTPPIYRVSLAGYGAAIPAGFLVSALAGAVALRFPSLLLTLILGFLAGRLVGEVMWYSSGWKRGPRLAAAAAGTVVAGTLVGGSLLARLWSGFPPAGLAISLRVMAESALLWIFAATSALVAYSRIR